MEKKIKENFSTLCLFLFNQERFKRAFFTALENSLFDFCVILLWKSLMLYIYEKFQQIRRLKESIFIEKWKVRSTEDKLRNYPVQNLYCFNKEKDDNIVSFLTVVYPLDTNYVNKINTLKSNRDIASHVCDEGLEFKIEQVKSYLDELLLVVKKLENLHFENYLQDLKEPEELLDKKPSFVEKLYFVSQLTFDLKKSSTFKQAQKVMDDILKLKDCISLSHIESILKAVYQDGFPLPINQILEASGGKAASRFLRNLFELEQNNRVDPKIWEDFYKKLQQQEYFNLNQADIINEYSWLAQKLNQNGEIPF